MTEPEKLGQLTHLNLSLSDGCSLACRHCWMHTSLGASSEGGQFLDINIAFQVVQEALPLGLRAVRLSGDLTLRYPHFDMLINWLETLGLAIHVETNGAGMTPQRADRLAALARCSASIALDGADAETHDAVQNTPGAFTAAVQAVNLLAEVGTSPQIVFPVTRRNAGQMEALVRLAERLGAGSVRFILVQPEIFAGSVPDPLALPQPTPSWTSAADRKPNGRRPGTRPLSLPPADLHIQEIIALGRRIERDLAVNTRLHLLVDQPPAFRGLQPQMRSEAHPRCGILNTIGVHPTGADSADYSLCSAGLSQPQFILGKAGLDPLEEIWNEHPILLLLRDGMPHRLEGICERCVMKTICMGNCAAENYFRTGSFWSPNWFCASAEQVGLFPAGRLIENQR